MKLYILVGCLLLSLPVYSEVTIKESEHKDDRFMIYEYFLNDNLVIRRLDYINSTNRAYIAVFEEKTATILCLYERGILKTTSYGNMTSTQIESDVMVNWVDRDKDGIDDYLIIQKPSESGIAQAYRVSTTDGLIPMENDEIKDVFPKYFKSEDSSLEG
ncbi:MAG: hypothetical protein AAF571_10935 [Verrucomicrobiota bacterium]